MTDDARLSLSTRFASVVATLLPVGLVVLVLVNSDGGELRRSWRFLAIPALYAIPGILAVMAWRGDRRLFVAAATVGVVAGLTSFSIPILYVFLAPAFVSGATTSQLKVGRLRVLGSTSVAIGGYAIAMWGTFAGQRYECWSMANGGESCSNGVIPASVALSVVAIVVGSALLSARILGFRPAPAPTARV